MMTLFQRLLKYYNINEKEYDAFIKLKEESDLPLPVDKSYFDLLERIKKSIKNDEKIIIYGDYDCDGITSTSILYLTIKKLGGSVGFLFLRAMKKDMVLQVVGLSSSMKKVINF